MTKRYRLTRRAEQDVLDIWLYIADENISAADKLVDRFTEVYERLADNPQMGMRQDQYRLVRYAKVLLPSTPQPRSRHPKGAGTRLRLWFLEGLAFTIRARGAVLTPKALNRAAQGPAAQRRTLGRDSKTNSLPRRG